MTKQRLVLLIITGAVFSLLAVALIHDLQNPVTVGPCPEGKTRTAVNWLHPDDPRWAINEPALEYACR